MNRIDRAFPRHDSTEAQHQQIRGLLVWEATPATARRPARYALVLPAAALAVVAAVGGAAAVTGSWGVLRGAAQPAAPVEENGCGYVRLASPTAGDGLRYLLASVPQGWSSTARVVQELSCDRGSDELIDTEPVVSFLQRDGEEITAALTVFRSLAPNTGADPAGVADGTADRSPTDGDDAGTIKNPPSAPVSVRSRPGRLIRADTLTWTEPDGQRWSVTSSGVSTSQLLEFADALVLKGRSATRPAATDGDYVRLPIPEWTPPAAQTWQASWQAGYTGAGLEGHALTVEVFQDRGPWQARLPEIAGWGGSVRLVDVNGRPGLLADQGGPAVKSLLTTTPNGKQLVLSGPAAATPLTEFAEQLQPVAADDPLIHEPDPAGN